MNHTRSRCVSTIGASVPDVETGRIALTTDGIAAILISFNLRTRYLEELISEATRHNREVGTNRPWRWAKSSMTIAPQNLMPTGSFFRTVEDLKPATQLSHRRTLQKKTASGSATGPIKIPSRFQNSTH